MYNIFYVIKCKPFGSKYSVSILYSRVMWEIKNKDYFWQCALCFTNLRLWLLSNLPPSRPLSAKDNFIQCWTGNIQMPFDLNIMLSLLSIWQWAWKPPKSFSHSVFCHLSCMLEAVFLVSYINEYFYLLHLLYQVMVNITRLLAS